MSHIFINHIKVALLLLTALILNLSAFSVYGMVIAIITDGRAIVLCSSTILLWVIELLTFSSVYRFLFCAILPLCRFDLVCTVADKTKAQTSVIRYLGSPQAIINYEKVRAVWHDSQY